MRRFVSRVAQALVGAAVIAAGPAVGSAVASPSAAPMAQIPGSYLPTSATETGQLSTAQMSVDVVLQPGNAAQLDSLLGSLYTPGSAGCGDWLTAGQFDSEFAPSQATVAAVASYLCGRSGPAPRSMPRSPPPSTTTAAPKA